MNIKQLEDVHHHSVEFPKGNICKGINAPVENDCIQCVKSVYTSTMQCDTYNDESKIHLLPLIQNVPSTVFFLLRGSNQ